MKLKQALFITTVYLLLFGFIGGCDTMNPGENENPGNVKLQVETATNTSDKAKGYDHAPVSVRGSNGELQIDELFFIVKKLKFEYEDDGCMRAGEDDCEDFEAKPFFVNLPLGRDTVSIGSNALDAGIYEEFEFKIKDLHFGKKRKKDHKYRELAETIRSEFPEWPKKASMAVTGAFTPIGREPQPFKVFIKAKIEIKHKFKPPLEVTDNTQRIVSFRLNPDGWLTHKDGKVINLGKYDWDKYKKVPKFSVKIKKDKMKIKVDDFKK